MTPKSITTPTRNELALKSLQDERRAAPSRCPHGDQGRSVLQEPAQAIKGLAQEKQDKYSCSINRPRAKQTHYRRRSVYFL